MASPDKTPQRPSPISPAAVWESYAGELEAVVVRLQQELDKAEQLARDQAEEIDVYEEQLSGVVRLQEALRGLMACLTVNENGLMVVDPDDWAEPWAEAVAVVSPDKPPEPVTTTPPNDSPLHTATEEES